MTIQTVAPGQKYLSSKNYEINFKDFDREFSLTIIRVDSLWQRRITLKKNIWRNHPIRRFNPQR
jgi:hypothetical protein